MAMYATQVLFQVMVSSCGVTKLQRLYGSADGYYSNIYDYNSIEVRQDNNTFVSGTLYINGSPYYIKGVDLTIGSTSSANGNVITSGPGNLNHSSSPEYWYLLHFR
jgi:hypothetical protein